MKIANKISLSFFTVAIVLTAAAGYGVYTEVVRSSRSLIVDYLEEQTESKKEHVETYLQMLQVSVAQLSKSLTLEKALKTPREDSAWGRAFSDAMLRLRRTKDANPAIYEFLLMDKSGIVIASSDKSSIGQDKYADDIFSKGKTGLHVKDAYTSDTIKTSLLAVSAPIVGSEDGLLLGVLAARVRMNKLNAIMTEITGLGKTGETYIVNGNGYMITPSRFLKDTFLRVKVDSENFRLAHAKVNNTIKRGELIPFRDYRGAKVIGASGLISQMNWSIMMEIDASEIFAPLVRLKIVIIFTALFASLAAWLTGVGISIIITRPIRNLHRGIEIIGEGNLDYKVGTPVKDEMGQLSRAFDTMTCDLKNKTVSIENLIKEVTERKAAEEALRESEYKYKAIFETSKDAIMMTTPEHGFFDGNSAALELFGCKDKEEFTSMGPADLSPEHQPDGTLSGVKAQAMMAIAMEKGSNFFEWTHKRVDGKEFYATVLLTSLNLKGEQVLQATVRDISAFKKAIDDISRLSAQNKLILQSASDGIIDLDLDGKHIFINDAGCKMLGYNIDELIGKKSHLIWHHTKADGSSYPEQECPIYKALHEGTPYRGVDEVFWKKNGVSFPVDYSATPMREGDKIIGSVVVFRDITERKLAEAKIIESEKMAVLGRFSGGAAHEIKNPLGIILGGAEFLQARLVDASANTKSTVDKIISAVVRANDIINALVSYSDPSPMRIEPISVHGVINDAITLIGPKLQDRQIQLKLDMGDDMRIAVDPGQVLHAITNILVNAVEATHSGGQICVRLNKGESTDLPQLSPSCRIHIIDNGTGIAADILPKIFEPFFTTKRDAKQVGLGLTTAKAIIESSNGSIHITSIEGKGTTVGISFPLAA